MPAQPKSAMRTRRQGKASQRYQDAKARRACCDVVWGGQTWGNCSECRAFVLRASGSWWNVGHVDEIVPRSLGGDPQDPQNCRLVCHACHFSGPSGAHRVTDREAVRRIVERELPL